MTRKDYRAIAQAMKTSKLPDITPSQELQHEMCCLELSFTLAVDNPRFDRTRFLAACGYDRKG